MTDLDAVLVVVTGLPGSGKTTLGRGLALELGLPFVDKDAILETLFDQLGVAGTDDRQRLSRASDAVLESVVRAAPGAVVTSFWRREELSPTSGTPTGWLREHAGAVEVYCDCPPEIAAARFVERRRHPGHLDEVRTSDTLGGQLAALADLGPWGLGPLVRVDTSGPVDARPVATAVRAAADSFVRGARTS